MADIKFSEFPKATTSKDSDEIAILQDGVNKMIASPVLESKIINKTVSRVIEQGGASLNVINPIGVVPTYADLDLITPTPELNDAYQVEADGLVYVYTENGFQAEGEGFNVQPDPIGVVEEGNPYAVSGGEVAEKAILKTDLTLNKIQLFSPENIVSGKYIDGDGIIRNLAGTSYGFIDINDENDNITLYWEYIDGNARRAIFVDGSDNIVGDVINAGLFSQYTFDIPDGAERLLFTIDAPNQTGVIDKNDIRAYYGTEYVPDSDLKIFKIDGREISQNVEKEIYTYNLVNPLNVHLDSTYNNGYQESDIYHATEPIDVVPGKTYYFSASIPPPYNGYSSPVRVYVFLNSSGDQISRITNTTAMSVVVPGNATQLICVYFNQIGQNGFCLSETEEGFKEYIGEQVSYFIEDKNYTPSRDNDVIRLSDLENIDTGHRTTINLSNSDKIMYTGSSSIESFYAPDRKAWVNKLQDFIDWQIVPYGWSGNNANQIAGRLLNNQPTQTANGVRPSEVNPTYIFIGQTLNSDDLLSNEFDTAFIESNENLLRSAVSITGAKPIIGTAYRTEFRPWIENSLKNLADKWGADFVPIGTWNRSMIRTNPLKYLGFYGSGHPAIRTHEAYTLPLLSYFTQLPRPKQGILIFEARNPSDDVVDLGYKDNFKRAEKFRSIQVGEMAIDSDDQHLYDQLDETYGITKVNTSEYMRLLKKESITLSNKVLLEIILPKVRTERVTINLEASNIDSYYIYNSLTQSFDVITDLSIIDRRYIEFDKVKLLCVGTNINISDISVDVFGGVEKPQQAQDRILPPTAGKNIIESSGFDDTTVLDWNIATNQRYNITTHFGDAKFNDMPAYLGESKDLLVLTDVLSRTFSLSNEDTFGYRKLRVWTCTRLNPKIYNPDEYNAWEGENNPYTNVSWYNENKYDYDDLNVIIKYNEGSFQNQCKSINIQKVGLFWNLGYVDVILPVTRDGSYELQIFRGSNNNEYPMELCDVSVEIL